ncbi:MAG: N-acetyltransferase family protein, partial [Pyrinomonadaceae bacterium]
TKHFRLEDEAAFVKRFVMNIRIATKDDVDSLVEFNQAMALETEGKRLDSTIVDPAVRSVFTDTEKGFYVVAEEDGMIVGGLLVTYEWSDWRNAWWWWVQSVYIRPEGRGKRIYSLLYDFVKAKAKDAGAYGIRLYVETENVHAQRVYEKVGMQRSNYIMYDEQL